MSVAGISTPVLPNYLHIGKATTPATTSAPTVRGASNAAQGTLALDPTRGPNYRLRHLNDSPPEAAALTQPDTAAKKIVDTLV